MSASHLLLAAFPIALTACASSGPPRVPDGPSVPVNSSETLAAFTVDRPSAEAIAAHRAAREVLFLPPSEEVVVGFDYGEIVFQPDPADLYRISRLAREAARIEVRGRTSGRNTPANRSAAQRRAESARLFLVEIGIDPALVSVNYTVGDEIADERRQAGRAANRRVELEFWPPVAVTEKTRS